MRDDKKFRKLKLQLAAALFLLLMIAISGILAFSSFSLEQVALALTGNYSKSTGDTLDFSDWNNLDDDFLAKSGGTMTGILNMGSNNISNLATPPVNPADVASKQYVDDGVAAMAVSGSGDIFINWGRGDCPVGTTEIYNGIGFSAPHDSASGGSNPVCLQGPPGWNPGDPYVGANADKLYPLVTGSDLPIDADSQITPDRVIKCAQCFKKGTCLVSYGSHDCSGSFVKIYDGYVLGSHGAPGDCSTATHRNSTERKCVNKNFDSSISAGGSMGAVWYGTRVNENFGAPYTVFTSIKCAVCCY